MNKLLGLPPGVAPPPFELQRYGEMQCPGPVLTSEWLTNLSTRLRGARTALRAGTVAARAGALARATRHFGAICLGEARQRPADAAGPSILPRLATVTGYSVPVLRLGIERLVDSVTSEALEAWWGALDPDMGCLVPDLVGVVSAGNIPGVALTPTLVSLLVGAPVLVKSSMAEPLLMPAWHAALAEVAPELAAACAVIPWPGGNEALESAAYGLADRLLVLGSDATVMSLARRFPGRVHGYGTGLSMGIVTAGARHPATARALAMDVAAWDQQGCLSPHGAFVEGSFPEVAEFGAWVAAGLARLEAELPRGPLPAAEAARLRNFRAEYEARSLAGEPVWLAASRASLAWTVVVEGVDAFRPSILNRTVLLWPLARLEEMTERLLPWRALLQGAGVAAEPGRAGEMERHVRAAGFPWSAPLGTLQAPPLRWPNKGRDLIQDILTPSSGEGDA